MGIFADRLALGRSLYITWWILSFKRRHVIEKIKTPLMKAIINLSTFGKKKEMLKAVSEIIRLCNLYPEPTKEHTFLPRTHILIDVQDEFFKHEHNPGRDALFRAMWRMFIIEYEHDHYYQYRIDWIIEELIKRGWGREFIKTSTQCWKE